MRPRRFHRRTRRGIRFVLVVAALLFTLYIVTELFDLATGPIGFVQTPYSTASSVFETYHTP